MMDIDWDNAPEGATHYNGSLAHPWLKASPASYFTEYSGWAAYQSATNAILQFSDAIPRPTKPAAPVWDGKGLPPVGCECEMIHPGIKNKGWQQVTIKALFDDRIVIKGSCAIWYPSGYAVIRVDDELKFRPIRTKEQRERDELIDLLRSTPADVMFGQFDDAPETLADAILAKYDLKERD